MDRPYDLGSTQLEILKNIASSDKDVLVNHLAQIIGRNQSVIFRSVESLISKNLLSSAQEEHRGRRTLLLTDKGACAAILFCEASSEFIRKRYKYLTFCEVIEEFRKFVRKPKLMDGVTNWMCELLIRYELFDNRGNIEKEIQTEFVIRENHLFLALKLEIVHRLLEKGPGEDLANYDRKGLVEFLRDLRFQYAHAFDKIMEEVRTLTVADSELMQDGIDENSKDFIYPVEPDDSEDWK